MDWWNCTILPGVTIGNNVVIAAGQLLQKMYLIIVLWVEFLRKL
ncbi:hypothetical protein HMPREF1552_01262 [Leptotrichia sp. oral taxon 879 str. F0557]|nr:hypothetical protein HMPREF1552_01262 [Leptotrichia sp. oral taxon 879 str. F0557]